MFCPGCGSEGQRADAYCKRCGRWIHGGGAGLAWYEFGKASPEDTLKTVSSLNVVCSVMAFACGVALFASLMLKTGIYFVGGLVSVYCILLALFQTWSYAVGRKLRRRLREARESGAGPGEGAAAPVLGPAEASRLAAAPSVAEQTTKHLEPVPARRPEGGEPR
ncbi:MAG TPA: hypothetical protein VN228_16095 [Pyrinomonadaceae bacterium]|nr:hypothetical protein [Pyrinomonadaceae bacterium]